MVALLASLTATVRTNPALNGGPFAAACDSFKTAMFLANLAEKNAVILTDDAKIAEQVVNGEAARAEADQALKDLTAIPGMASLGDLAALQTTWSSYLEINKEVMALAAENTATRATRLIRTEVATQQAKVTGLLHQISSTAKTQMTDVAAAAQTDYEGKRLLLIAMALVAVIGGVIAALWISLLISRGLTRAVDVARKVALGDLWTDTATTAKDEIGDLLGAMGEMSEALKKMTAVAEQTCKGDLTVTTERRSNEDSLGIAP